jgi:hypothetical protein
MANYFDKYVYVPDNATATPGPYFARISLPDAAAQHTTAVVNRDTFATPLSHIKSKRRKGLRPRYVNLRLDTGTTPNILTRHRAFLVLLPTDFAYYLANPMSTITISGAAWTIEDFVRENIVT